MHRVRLRGRAAQAGPDARAAQARRRVVEGQLTGDGGRGICFAALRAILAAHGRRRPLTTLTRPRYHRQRSGNDLREKGFTAPLLFLRNLRTLRHLRFFTLSSWDARRARGAGAREKTPNGMICYERERKQIPRFALHDSRFLRSETVPQYGRRESL